MTEGRVFWNYTCPSCGRHFAYCMFAGSPRRICDECKEKEDK